MKAGNYDWTQFDIHFYYAVPREAVFRAWATAAGLESFFIEKARFVSAGGEEKGGEAVAQSGDRYHWHWRHGGELEGRFLEVVEGESVRFTFGSMEVSVRLVEVEGATRLDLLQTGIPDTAEGRVASHLNCRSCWIFFLTNLKSVLEHAHDLCEARRERVNGMEVGFEIPASEAPATV